jgi:hypothetical protein
LLRFEVEAEGWGARFLDYPLDGSAEVKDSMAAQAWRWMSILPQGYCDEQ